MHRPKLLQRLFVLVALLQMAVPVGLIWRYEFTLRTGRAYKFRTAPVDPYDAFRGRYVALQFAQTTAPVREQQVITPGQRVYVSLEKGQDGFARLKEVSTTPPGSGEYLTVPAGWQDTTNNTVTLELPFTRFYMEETAAPQAEHVYRTHSRTQDAYVIVRVRDGRGVIENLFIEDTPITDFLRHQEKAP